MTTAATCPNCKATLVPSRDRCLGCGMEVAKMNDYRRAMAAAAKRGRTVVEVEAPARAPMVSGDTIKRLVGGAAAILAVVGLYFLVSMVFAKPRPWLALPTDEETAVRKYLELVGTDDKKQHGVAYSMISKYVKNPQNDNEPDHYLQFHHDIYRYLAGEFGPDWSSQLTIAPTPGQAHNFTVNVGPPQAGETLRIQVADQSPPGETPRWGIAGIAELDANSAARSNSREGIYGVLRVYGAGGAIDNLKAIIGTQGSYGRETPMESKMRLLGRIRESPRAVDIDYAIMQLWKVRNDPYARVRLGQIIEDGRFGDITRSRAKAVLDGTLSEEERIAAHVEGD